MPVRLKTSAMRIRRVAVRVAGASDILHNLTVRWTEWPARGGLQSLLPFRVSYELMMAVQFRTVAIIARRGDVIHNILCGRPDRDTTCCGNVRSSCEARQTGSAARAWVVHCQDLKQPVACGNLAVNRTFETARYAGLA